MEFKDYQNKIYRAIPNHESQKDEILHWAIGLSEECGEVMSVLKHHYYGGEDFNREEMIKEIGDVLWYTAALCTAAGVNMDSIAKLNVEKLLHRFPDEVFDDSRSADRHNIEQKFSETDRYRELMEEALKW